MPVEHWEQIKEAFWQAVETGEAPADHALDADARSELRDLLDEHSRLTAASRRIRPATADVVAATGRFEVLDLLGSGAFGDVYSVVDRASGSTVALKVLRTPQASALYYFKREFRFLADTRHRNLVALHELIEHQGQWMFTMELVRGTSINQYLNQLSGARRDTQLRDCVLQLAAGLHALHERHLLHRDLKPSNVHVTPEGRVVVLDFGLARPFRVDRSMAATFVGTPEYMSPEQISGTALTAASDWYGLGVVLYEALTGRPPFTGSLLGLFHRKLHDRPSPPSDIAEVPEDLDELCLGLLAPDPDARFGIEEIERILGCPPATAPRRAGPSHALVGRAPESRRLRAAFERLLDNRPVMVHLFGPSGIGKSSLVREFVGTLDEDADVLAFQGRCFESESVAYQGLDDVIDSLSAFLRRLDRHVLQQVLPRQMAALSRMFPVLAGLQGSERSDFLPADSQERRRLAFAALSELFRRLAERHRVVVAVDDLQWADADGCKFFEQLLVGPEAPAIFVLLAYRSEALQTNPWLASLRDSVSGVSVDIPLGPLNADETARLAQSLAGSGERLPRPILERVQEHSGGEPFLVHEIMKWATARGGAAGALAGDFSLSNVVRRRTADLDGDSARLLELVAVAEQPVARSVLQAACASTNFVGCRDRLLRDHLVRSHLVQGRELLETYHDRLRTVLLSLLPAPTVVERHRELAEALELPGSGGDSEQAAKHFQAAGEPQRAARHALVAAGNAMEILAFNKAAALYESALAAGALGAPERRATQRALGDAWSAAGNGAAAARAYLEASADADASTAIRLRTSAAGQLLRCGHIPQGLAMLDGLIRQTGLKVWRNRALRLLHVAWLRARIGIRGLRAATPREQSETERLRLDVCWTGAVGTSMLDPLRSAEFSSLYVLLALESGDPTRVLLALAGESTQRCHVPSGGDIRKSYALLAQATDMAQRAGDPYSQAFTTLMRSIVALLHGNWSTAGTLGDAAAGQFRAECNNVAWEQSTAHIITFSARAMRGDWTLNRERLPELVRDAEERGDLQASVSLRLIGAGYIIGLADDAPGEARAQLRADLASWPHETYDLQRACALIAEVDIGLYADTAADAWTLVLAEWPSLVRSQLLRVPTMFATALFAHARAALGAARSCDLAPRREQLLRVARADGRRIARKAAPWAHGFAHLVEAGVGTFGPERDAVRRHLRRAEDALTAADLIGFAMAARWRRGAYEAPEDAGRLRADVRTWAAREGVKNVERFAACLAPGRYD